MRNELLATLVLKPTYGFTRSSKISVFSWPSGGGFIAAQRTPLVFFTSRLARLRHVADARRDAHVGRRAEQVLDDRVQVVAS